MPTPFYIGSQGSGTLGGSITLTTTVDSPAGNFIFIMGGSRNGAPAGPGGINSSITDSAGNSYRWVVNYNAPTGYTTGQTIWVCENARHLPIGSTITGACPWNVDSIIVAGSCDGIIGTLDVASPAVGWSGSSSVTVTAGPFTTFPELVLGFSGYWFGGSILSAGAPFSNIFTGGFGSTSYGLDAYILPSTSAISYVTHKNSPNGGIGHAQFISFFPQQNVVPGTEALTITGYNPAIVPDNALVRPGVGALHLTGYVPTVALPGQTGRRQASVRFI